MLFGKKKQTKHPLTEAMKKIKERIKKRKKLSTSCVVILTSNSFVRSSMFDIKVCDSGARIIRDALRLYKKQWPGGHPQEQEDINFLETQFTRMVLESTMDA